MKKRNVLLSILVIFSAISVAAQTTANPPELSAGVHFAGGYMFSDFTELNQLATDNNFRAFEQTYTYFETGLSLGKLQKSYMEILIGTFLQETISISDRYASLLGVSMFANLNRTVFFTPKNYIGLYGGVGFTGLTVEFSDQSGANGTFADALSGLRGQRTVYTGPLPQIDLGIKYQRVWRDFGKKILISVKGGYRIDLLPTEWGTDGWLLSDGPNVNAGGGYVQIGFGMF